MRKLTYKEVKEYIEGPEGNGCKLLSTEYINKRTKLEILCRCGEKFYTTFGSFKSSNRKQCPKCGRKNGNKKKSKLLSFDYEEVNKYIESRGCELLSPTYINNRTKLDIRCKCGKIFKRNFHDFKDGGKELCPDCANIQKGLSQRNRKIVKCGYCNKEIERCPSSIHDLNFCNQECYAKWRSVNFKGGNNPAWNKKIVKCDYCNKEIERCESSINKMNFCDRKCQAKWQSENKKGENSNFYNPNLTEEERKDKRQYTEYYDWREEVKIRDDYTCQCCGKRGGILNSHHLNGYNWYKEGRTDINNGITLCENKCHKEFHTIYGKGNNTKEQFIEFLTNKYKETQDQYFIDLIEKINNRLS